MAYQTTILHVIAPARFGGAEAVVLELIHGLSLRNWDVGAVVLIDEQAEHPFERALTECGATVAVVRSPPRGYCHEAQTLTALFGDKRPAVVHTHGFRADLQAGRVARRLTIPRISTVHGFTGGGLRVRLNEWLQVRTLRDFDAVVAVSRPLMQHLARRAVPANRLHLVRNAWSPDPRCVGSSAARAMLNLPGDTFVLGWVGRLSPEKGGDVFIQALASLSDLPVLACIIGDGPELRSLQDQASKYGLADRIRWCGVRHNAGRLFRAFDAFVLSSRTEGTPIVLFEAMHAGVPIVATSVGGVPDVVGEGEAWLIPRDDPEALAQALRGLFADEILRERRVAAGRARLRTHFSVAPWIANYERIYERLIGC